MFMGTDEIPLGRSVGAMFDFHWRDHAGQLAKIRRATGLPGARPDPGGPWRSPLADDPPPQG
jgi:hypothetical protein